MPPPAAHSGTAPSRPGAPWGTALITGASSGIGAEFCRQLAAAGSDVVAVARRGERLDALASELSARHGTRVLPCVVDLGEPDSVPRILAYLADRDIAIDTLVNNAGYGVPGRFLSQPWPVHARYLQVMQGVVAELCHALLPPMQAHRRGTIINVASLAGHLPGTAGHTLYAASKSWLIRFSESLSFEHGADGIQVCALCPGFTYSEFHDVTGTRAQVARMPRWLWMDAPEVVRLGLEAAARGERVYIPGRVNRAVARAARWLPPTWLYSLTARQSHRFRDQR